MALRQEHELHLRRKGRNVGVGLLLGGFIVLIFALTYVKITNADFSLPDATQMPDATQTPNVAQATDATQTPDATQTEVSQ